MESPRWRARNWNPASRRAAREKGGVFTSPWSQTNGLSFGLTQTPYVTYDILSSGAKEAGNRLPRPRFWPLKGQHNAQAKLRGLRISRRAAVSFSLLLDGFVHDDTILLSVMSAQFLTGLSGKRFAGLT